VERIWEKERPQGATKIARAREFLGEEDT